MHRSLKNRQFPPGQMCKRLLDFLDRLHVISNDRDVYVLDSCPDATNEFLYDFARRSIGATRCGEGVDSVEHHQWDQNVLVYMGFAVMVPWNEFPRILVQVLKT